MSFAEDSTAQPTATVHRLSVEPVEPRPRRPTKAETPSTTPEIAPHEPEPVPERQAAPPPVKSDADYLIAMFRVAALILSARGLLAICLFGAFILAAVSILKGGVLPLVTLGVYCIFTIGPLVWLEIGRGQRREAAE